MAFDPYETLGVERDADLGTIRARYRQLAKTHHPDKGGDREQWDWLVLAHTVLTDTRLREHYDTTGEIDKSTPENDRQQASELIAMKVNEVADRFTRADFHVNYDPRRMDVVETVRRFIANELGKAEQAAETGKKQLAFVTDYAKRFKRKKGARGLDRLAAVMAERVRLTKEQMLRVDDVIRVHRLALEMIEDYTFEREEAEPAATHTVTIAGMGTFSGTSI